MPRVNAPFYAINGGEVGPEAINRLDLDRLQRASELCQNIFPTVIGRMDFRPGMEYLNALTGQTTLIPFIRGADDLHMLALNGSGIRVQTDGVFVTRAAVSTAILNGDFDAATNWADNSTGTASIVLVGDGQLILRGASGSRSITRQTITVSGSDANTRHAIELDVTRGSVILRIGTTAGADNALREVTLGEGFHSIGFTPETATGYIVQLSTDEDLDVILDSVQIASVGNMVLPQPWAAADFPTLQIDQSLDVMYVASDRFQQRQIEFRAADSWSIVRYRANDGPFDPRVFNDTTLTASAVTHTATITASERLFTQNHVGSLVRVIHQQQQVNQTFTAANQQGNSIRVTGTNDARIFNVSIAVDGSWDGTITLEQSIGEEGNWTNFRTYTGNVNQSVNDGLDNQIVFYRLTVQAGDFVAGSANTILTYAGGETRGIVRITAFTSETEVTAEVLAPLGSTDATTRWELGSWSDENGWPDTVSLHDGRLWWLRDDLTYGSVSDAFTSYDDQVTGDSAPVIRSIGGGSGRWLLSLQRLMVGTNRSEVSIRASSFDEPLTATAFVPRDASTRGVADVPPVKIDTSGVFVQRSGFRIFDMFYSVEANDYTSRDLTELHNNICRPGVVATAAQRQPDTRVWFVLSNGEARVLVYEPSEQVVGWCRVVTDGAIEDVAVLPTTDEDEVHFVVRRTINGVEQRSIERLANSQDALGGNINRMADSFVHVREDVATTVVTGLSHLEGEQVIVWADGAAVNDQDNMLTVSGGQITVAAAANDFVVGLPYTGRWTSTKLAYGAGLGTALTQYKKVDHVGFALTNTAPDGIRLGRDFTSLTKIATRYRGRPLVDGEVLTEWDQDASQFNGGWSTDARVNFEMKAPYPVHVAAIVVAMKTNDRG